MTKQLSLLLATNEVRSLTTSKWYEYMDDALISSYTKNAICIWGKNTYTENVDKEYLKSSKNIIISSNKDCGMLLHSLNTKQKIVKVRTDVTKALDYASSLKEREIIIMGGASVYQSAQTLKQVNRLLLVVVKGQEQSTKQLLNYSEGKLLRKDKLSDNVFFIEMIINENYEVLK